MRIVGEIPNQGCKITIFSWNNRYIVKFERDNLEQTYKIDQYDIADENDLKKLIDERFTQKTLKLFEEMENCLTTAMHQL